METTSGAYTVLCITDLDILQMFVICIPSHPLFSDDEKQAFIEWAYEEAEKITGCKDAADPYSYAGKAAMVHDMGIHTGIADMMVTCKWHTKWVFIGIGPDIWAKALSAGLGKKISADSLIDASIRLRLLERSYECLEGRRRADDTIPEKEFDNPVSRGPWKGMTLDRKGFEKMKTEYYELRGWDVKTGVPKEDTLKEYGLEDLSDALKEKGI